MSAFENLLIIHCSPTLIGLKQANLFSCPIEEDNKILSDLERYNTLLNPKGIYFKVLYQCNSRFFIMAYRKQPLLASLQEQKVVTFLSNIGYPLSSSANDSENILDYLSSRITGCDEFPHEIGLFLGYPAEDVFAFIENRGENYKFCGYWKVYSNEEAMKKLFRQYRKCTEVLLTKAQAGTPILHLLGVA